MIEGVGKPVPIVGAAYVVRQWWVEVLVQCGCPAKLPLLLNGVGAVGTCPACGRSVQVKGLAVNPATGQVDVLTAPVAVVPKGTPVV